MADAPAWFTRGVGGTADQQQHHGQTATIEQEEADMLRREEALLAREIDARVPNYPAWRPVVFHSIEIEVEPEHQALVRRTLFLFWMTAISHVCNLIIITMSLAGAVAGTTSADWFLAIAFTLVGIPAAWRFWYRGIYRSASSTTTSNAASPPPSTTRSMNLCLRVSWSSFIFHFSIHLALCIWMASSFPEVGGMAAGFFKMVEAIRDGSGFSYFIAAACALAATTWVVNLAVSIDVLRQAVRKLRAK